MNVWEKLLIAVITLLVLTQITVIIVWLLAMVF